MARLMIGAIVMPQSGCRIFIVLTRVRHIMPGPDMHAIFAAAFVMAYNNTYTKQQGISVKIRQLLINCCNGYLH